MKSKHNEMNTSNEGSLKNAYNDMTSLIETLLIRVNFMIDTYRRWVNHEIENADATKYDEDENKAILQATKSLNDIIINKLGLSKEAILSIMCDATNTVRKTIGLESLDYDKFSVMYLNGLAGSPMRLFNI